MYQSTKTVILSDKINFQFLHNCYLLFLLMTTPFSIVEYKRSALQKRETTDYFQSLPTAFSRINKVSN